MEIASKILKQAPVKWKSLKWLQNSNLKDIPADALSKLKKSLTENDFIQPFNVWEDPKGVVWILDGHHREKALKELEAEGVTIPEELPANFIDCKTKKDAAKLVLVYSSIYARVSDQGLFDFLNDFELKIEDLTDIDLPTIDLNAWEQKHFPKADESTLDEVPAVQTEVYSEKGDIFVLDGKHRVMCGDSTNAADVALLMNGNKADMVFTDPPYGVSYQSNRRTKSAKFDVLKNDDKILNFLPQINDNSTGWVFICASWKVLKEWIDLFTQYFDLTNMVIWYKGGGGIGDLQKTFLSDFEVILVSNRGKSLQGKRIGSVWQINKDSAATYSHPTQKPFKLAALAIDSTTKGKTITLDLFLGSGSTLIAAEQTSRICYGMEIDPQYIDVILRRYKKTYPNAKIECETRNFPFDALFSEEK